MKKQSVSMVGSVLTIEYPSINKMFSVDTAKYSKLILECALRHGFKQKFGDAASGKSAAEKLVEVNEIHLSLLAGEWERTASPDLTPIICEAVARIKKMPLAKVQKVAEGNEEQVKTWGSNMKVKAEILKIRAERAAKAAEDSEEEIDIEIK